MMTVLALAATLMCLMAAGRLATGRRMTPEADLVAGWGAFCLIMTGWAAVSALPLVLPAAAFALASLAGLRGDRGIVRMAALSLPVWLVLSPARPSQVDTWLNLLPNLAYLADHLRLPADGGPPSWSFLPAAPYNTQFVGFAASVLSRGLASNAISLFNLALLCAAGLHIARTCNPGSRSPAWWACALGLLLAVPLNPGFVPRVFLASYGEAPIAVTLMFATALGADLFAAARARTPVRATLTALALVLAALVEIKQSALGLLLPFSACLLALGFAAPGMRRRRWSALVGLATAPALALYLAYRWYVLTHFAVGELKMLPLAEWHLNLMPQILGGIAFAMFQKATYFLSIVAALAAAAVEAKRRPWQRAAIVLALGVGLIVGFNAFLLFTYVAHFPAIWAVHAHSYFRYMSQLSLVVMLGLVTWLYPAVAAWFAGRTYRLRRRVAVAAICAVVALPVFGVRFLRFDLDAPQPFLWDIGHRTAGLLPGGARVALVMPGDGDDAVGSMLRGVLLFTEPRRRDLDFRSELAATPAALEDARAAGFTFALVTCAPLGLADVPAGRSGLLAYEADGWHARAVWRIPAELARARFSAMMPRQPFCLRPQMKG